MEINYNELYGIEEGAEAPEVAEPETDTAEVEGEEAPEVAEPEVEAEGTEVETTEEPPKQSAEENARYAAIRRKAEAERDAAIKAAKEDAAKEVDKLLADSGLVNPYTHQAIKNKADYDEYIKARADEQKRQVIRKTGMTDEEFSRFVDDLPEIREARAAKREADEAKTAAQNVTAKAKIDEQLSRITAINPKYKTLNDLTSMPHYTEFYDKVKKGYSLDDAYKLTHEDEILSRQQAAASQQTRNLINSKAHMVPTTQRGAGSVTVPEEIKQAYRDINPGITDADIQKHYQKYLKK